MYLKTDIELILQRRQVCRRLLLKLTEQELAAVLNRRPLHCELIASSL